MASSLHQQLKQHFVADPNAHEVMCRDFRIDAVDKRGRLIEIQCASLAAIRRKVQCLLETHQVIVAKPLASRKLIVRQEASNGPVISRRYSPLRQSLMHVFEELVHFVPVFPHPGLRLDVLLTEQEEIRIPSSARRCGRKPWRVTDRRLMAVHEHLQLTTPSSLWNALDISVPERFTTADLARAADMPRWLCQKAAWCFRNMSFFEPCDQVGNAVVYRIAMRRGRRSGPTRQARRA